MASDAAAVISRIPKTTLESAVTALLKYKTSQSATQKPQLLPDDDYIYLNLTLKKIPPKSRTNPFRIALTHPVLDFSSQLCLIIDDRPQSPTLPSDQMKKLIKSQNIPISKVIKLSKLKTNYKPFEAKRKLCDSYDLFLADKRVVHLLPKLIGKEFFKKKKLPIGVDLSKKNLKSQVESILGSSLLFLRTGTCCVMKVGKIAMENDEIVENVVSAIKGAVEKLPKKWDGVRSLHLKFCGSIALPIYQAMPDVKLKIEGLKEMEHEVEVAKISDSEGEVKDTVGKSRKKKNKGRIHEVRYMDVGEGMETDEDEVDNARSEDNDEIEEKLTIEVDNGDKRNKDEDSNGTLKKKNKKNKSVASKETSLVGVLDREVQPKVKKSENKKLKKDKRSVLKEKEQELEVAKINDNAGEVKGTVSKSGKKKSNKRIHDDENEENLTKANDHNNKDDGLSSNGNVGKKKKSKASKELDGEMEIKAKKNDNKKSRKERPSGEDVGEMEIKEKKSENKKSRKESPSTEDVEEMDVKAKKSENKKSKKERPSGEDVLGAVKGKANGVKPKKRGSGK